MKNNPLLAVLPVLAALAACRAKPAPAPETPEVAFAPPTGRRAFALSLDKSQTRFLSPGDAVEIDVLVETPRADGTAVSRTETLAARAEVLRVEGDWSDDDGLVQLALSPQEAEYAALAVQREDRIFLNKLANHPALTPLADPPKAELAFGMRGLSALVEPDQEEFLDPGDRVDVIVAARGGKAGGKSESSAETLLQDALVLESEPAQGHEEWATVQLMLTPQQASELARALAAEDDLTLAARAPGDRATAPVEPAKMSRKFGTAAERGSPRS